MQTKDKGCRRARVEPQLHSAETLLLVLIQDTGTLSWQFLKIPTYAGLQRTSAAAYCPSTEKSIAWDWIFVSPRICRRIDTEIELLSQILASPVLRPHIPYSHVVQRHVNCSPWHRIHLKQEHGKQIHQYLFIFLTWQWESIYRRANWKQEACLSLEVRMWWGRYQKS